MKKLVFALFTAVFASCGYENVQVEFPDGKVQWVVNNKDVNVSPGDSVIVDSYTSFKHGRSHHSIYGYYRGKVPMHHIDSNFMFTYNMAVVLQ